MTTIAQLLEQRTALSAVSDTPLLDSELLLCHCLSKSRSYLKAWPEVEVTADVENCFQQLFQRRVQGEPIAHLIGYRGFWNFDLLTDTSTLIPRPETELLVEKSLELLADRTTARVLDLGTGTGAIALALASERPQWQLFACDVQPQAVALAERNRRQLGLENVTIFTSSWFDDVAAIGFDLVVSNPPYIDAEDPHLQQGDVRFEPRSALVAGNRGFADIDIIIDRARGFLLPGGWLLLEHGYDQREGVCERFQQAGYEDVFTAQDLAGHDRVSGGRYSA